MVWGVWTFKWVKSCQCQGVRDATLITPMGFVVLLSYAVAGGLAVKRFVSWGFKLCLEYK